MKLIKPYFEVMTPINGEEILKQIELATRTCYKSEDKIEYEDLIDTGVASFSVIRDYTAISARPLIKMLIAKGHEAMLEFGSNLTVKFVCDRGVSHELVRHRIASFAQESTCYCNYGKDEHITFIIPCWFTDEYSELMSYLNGYFDNGMPHKGVVIWLDHMNKCEREYNELITLGWQPQEARSVLPNSLKTEINVSANIREWRHIFKLRTAKTAHPQMRELMIPLLSEFKSKIPILFDDID